MFKPVAQSDFLTSHYESSTGLFFFFKALNSFLVLKDRFTAFSMLFKENDNV